MTRMISPIPPTHEGWFYSRLSGSYEEIGFQHGAAHWYMISKILDRMRGYIVWSTGFEWDFIRQTVWNLWWRQTPENYQKEMSGIAQGATSEGARGVTVQDIFLWNAWMEVLYYFIPTFQKQLMGSGAPTGQATAFDSCSAFIATGKATSDGSIVMGHSTFSGFELAYFKLILDITPPNGHRFVMQTAPGLISSSTDFGVNDAGLMITETTIGGFNNYCSDAATLATLVPEFVRARQCLELAGNLEDFRSTMLCKNTGGYANSWLVGERKTGRIMRYELGYRYEAWEESSDGYFIGFNAAIDPKIRNLECSNSGYMDIRRHQGARQVRLRQLMEDHLGRLTTEEAKRILADHYDPYLSQIQGKDVENICARNVDAHYELDAREYMSQPGRPLPFQPQGAVDGKVMDSGMASELSFEARWGSPSGMAFDAHAFFVRHPQYLDLAPYIDDRPSHNWIGTRELARRDQPKTILHQAV